jgi:Na+/proline symporter
MFFGLCAIGYEAGIAGIVIGIAYCIGLILLGFAIPKIKAVMQSENCDTMDDFVGLRYGKAAQLCVTLINLILFMAILAAQFIALSAFLKVFAEIDSIWSFYIAVFVVLTYTALAGFKGVIFTDKWQFYILSVSAVVIFIILTLNADFSAVKALDPSYFNATGYGVAFPIAVLLFFSPSILVRTDLWQRIAAAKDAKKAQRAFFISAPVLLIFYIILTFVGIYGRAALGEGAQPDTSGFVHFLSIARGSSEGALGFGANVFLSILALGVFSALLSTADTNLNVISVAISKLLKRKDWKKFEDETPDKIEGQRTEIENKLLNITRVLAIVLGIVSLLVAKAVPNIVNLIVAGASAITVFLPSVLMALFKGRRNKIATISSIVCGFVVLLVLLPRAPKIAFMPAALIAVITYFSVALFTKKKKQDIDLTS